MNTPNTTTEVNQTIAQEPARKPDDGPASAGEAAFNSWSDIVNQPEGIMQIGNRELLDRALLRGVIYGASMDGEDEERKSVKYNEFRIELTRRLTECGFLPKEAGK